MFKNTFLFVAGSMLIGCAAASTGDDSISTDDALTNASPHIVGLGGNCLDVAGGNSAIGTRVQIWDCNGTAAQKWTLQGNTIVGLAGKCLDVAGGSSASGTQVQIWDCNGTAAQSWTVAAGGTLVGLGGKCLDVRGGVNAIGTPIQIWDCNGTDAQKWNIVGTPSQLPAPTVSCAGSAMSRADAMSHLDPGNGITTKDLGGAGIFGYKRTCYPGFACSAWQEDDLLTASGNDNTGVKQAFASITNGLTLTVSLKNGDPEIALAAATVQTKYPPYGMLCNLGNNSFENDTAYTLSFGTFDTSNLEHVNASGVVAASWSSFAGTCMSTGDLGTHWNNSRSGSSTATLALASSTGGSLPPFSGLIAPSCVELETEAITEQKTDAQGNAFTIERRYRIEGQW